MFDKFYITDIGQTYFAKLASGSKLVITKAQIGSGFLPSGQTITAMTALVTPLKDLSISKYTASGNTSTVYAQFTNKTSAGILDPFWWAEVGLFGKIDGDSGNPEALIAYANALDQAHADYISASLTEFLFNWNLSTSNASSVSAVINQSLVFMIDGCDTASNTVSFTEAAVLVAPASGDSHATLWGKVKKLFSSLGTAAYTNSSAYATAAQGTKADGAIPSSIATAANQMMVSTAASTWVIKTLDEIKALLGLGGAAYKTAGSASGNIPLNGSDLGTTTNAPIVTNASGQLIPHASGAIGAAAFKAVSDFQAPTNNLTTGAAIADDDYMPYYDSSDTLHRKTLWINIKLRLQTFFDTLYSKLGHTHLKSEVGLENVDNTADANKAVASAGKLTTSQTIRLTGDVTGSASFDGSAAATIAATVAASGGSIVVSAYTGDSMSTNIHFTALGYKPKAVIIMSSSSVTCIVTISGDVSHGVIPGVVTMDGNANGNGFTLQYSTEVTKTDNYMNTNGKTYTFIIFK